MKLMKRILAIVCTFVMIISMATGVNAVGPSKVPTKRTTGTITVTNAKAGETYKVYKILSLESYDASKEAYSYKRTGDKWDEFVNNTSDYLSVNNDDYVSFKADKNDETGRREFAIKAMQYVKDHDDVQPTDTKTAPVPNSKDTGITVKFENLPFGYYLIESGAGTACSLATLAQDVNVKDKHESPIVDKKVIEGADLSGNITENGKKNSVSIGDTVLFEVTIHAQPNTQNYVLHDVMDEHIHFDGAIYQAYVHTNQGYEQSQNNPSLSKDEYVLDTKPGDGHTFDVSFTDKFYDRFKNDIDSRNLETITIKYTATVQNTAPTNTAMPNTAYLTYGNHSKTDESQTNTYTWSIPVYKYTEKAGEKVDLAGAKFILSTNEIPTKENALKFSKSGSDFLFDSTKGSIELESYTDGMINIKGLKSGTYYLKETKAPDGYNVLKTPIKIVVEGDDKTGQPEIKVDKNGKATVVPQVEVLNNKGSLLPSTGGMGTTLIYVVGSILVLASGIVLFSKRKEGTN